MQPLFRHVAVRDTHLVEVRVFSEEPDEAARIANAIVKAYLEYRRETREELNTANFHLLEQKHEENEQKIQRLQAA